MKKLIWLSIAVVTASFFVIGCAKPVIGPVGPAGAIGPAGPSGQAGERGADGVAGSDGTIIYAVQFCPGYTPTQYPEQGICIDGKLFAEWYAPPSSGLVYLPDGNYVSTQTGAPCSFVVTGCAVSP